MKAITNPRWTHDPFNAALIPPPEETEEQRAKRVQEEENAARISREIDESLLQAKKLIDRRKKATKVLLLGKLNPLTTHPLAFIPSKGQAESGKSTTLKSERPHVLPCPSFSS